jgi:hypothetical protein
MINELVMQALSQWDNPQMFEDIQVYMDVSALLVVIMQKDIVIETLPSGQLALLQELVSLSMEATINAFEQAQDHHKALLISILEALTIFADEVIPAASKTA